MSIQPPKIDNRSYEDIVKQTEKLVKEYTGWKPPSEGKADAGMALIRIFSRMAALVSDRLNQVPDKNFLAFLDLIGTQLLPPQPAKVPLTFSLTEGSSVDAVVPTHTQVAAPPAEGREDEVVFETDRELVVTTAQLKAVFVREPGKDLYSDRTLQATGKEDAAFEAFAGEQPIEHCLYLACDELFALPGNKTVTLKFHFTEKIDLTKLPISWSYCDGSWRSLSPSTLVKDSNWEVTIQSLPVLTRLTINGIETGWLRASLLREQSFLDENAKEGTAQLKVKDVRGFIAENNNIRISAGSKEQEDCKITKIEDKTLTLDQPLKYSHPKDSSVCLSKLPTINCITVSANIKQNDLTPEFCFFNTVPLDLSKDFYPFGEQPRFNDTLYIASKEVFGRPKSSVTINVELSSPPPSPIIPSPDLELEWEVWNGQIWQSLKTLTPDFEDKTSTFTKNGNIKFILPDRLTPVTVSGENKYWIRTRIVKGNFGTELSQATIITLLTEESKTTSAELKVNSVRGFMPNDRIQILSGGRNPEEREIESCDTKENKLTLKTALSQPYPKGTSVRLLSISAFGPPSVKLLTLSYSYEASGSLSACRAYNDFHYIDLLNSVLIEKADKGQKSLKLASVAGLVLCDRLWIDRTEEREIEAIDLEQRTVTVEPGLAADRDAGTLVKFFTILQAEAKKGETIFNLSSVKHFRVGDRLQIVPTNDSTTQECEIEGVNLDRQTVTIRSALTQDLVEKTKVLQSFQPFKTTADRNPTLYLGFDKQFANRLITLFAQVEPPLPGKALKEQSNNTEPVQLVWEYRSLSGWSSLGVQDETKGFAEGGLIQFIGPTDLTKSSEFGQELYWLRVRWEAGEFRVPPRLKRILTNTMWATQATTLTNEILGSSDGNPNQIFRTVQKPVLQGEQLEVQEGKIPSPNDVVNVVRDEAGQIEAVWVRWQKVRDFYGSGSRDRHYVLDRLTGEVRFGDGQYGMVPPLGRNNIRLSQYQTGGGTRGNLAANTVVQLKTTVPYIEKVTNLEATGGGAEQESLEQVKERGPKWLRHRDRAVTIQDFEDLAYEASPDVARAKAIYPDFSNPLKWLDKPQNDPEYEIEVRQHQDIAKNRQVKLLIVPKSAEKQPIPSLALIDCVQNYLRVRCTPTVDFQVIAPDWLKISVTADIVLRSLDITDSIQTVARMSLEAFLHPLTGNTGQGWNFGEQPYESDLYALLQSIDGVNYIRSLTIDATPSRKLSQQEQKEQKDKQLTPPSFLICSGSHTLNFTF